MDGDREGVEGCRVEGEGEVERGEKGGEGEHDRFQGWRAAEGVGRKKKMVQTGSSPVVVARQPSLRDGSVVEAVSPLEARWRDEVETSCTMAVRARARVDLEPVSRICHRTVRLGVQTAVKQKKRCRRGEEELPGKRNGGLVRQIAAYRSSASAAATASLPDLRAHRRSTQSSFNLLEMPPDLRNASKPHAGSQERLERSVPVSLLHQAYKGLHRCVVLELPSSRCRDLLLLRHNLRLVGDRTVRARVLVRVGWACPAACRGEQREVEVPNLNSKLERRLLSLSSLLTLLELPTSIPNTS